MFDFLSQKFSSLFSGLEGVKKITKHNIQEALDTVQEALLEADVPYGVVQTFITSVKNDVVGQHIVGALKPAEQLMSVVQHKIVDFLGGDDTANAFLFPSTVMVMGLQGSGKTTTIGKLAYKIKKDAEKNKITKKILVGSVDFYRPAALDQLEVLARQVNVFFYRAESNDPVLAAKEIFAFGKNNGYDVILLDTAGRLHIDNTMLQELQEIDALLRPAHKVLVLDAMTGQESLAVAKAFDDIIGFHGAILTKMDSDTRGGAAFAFRFVLKKPIIFIGEGEKIIDLNVFYPDRAAERILGMGDIRTLIERAEEKISVDEQEKAEKAFNSGSFSLQDFADQMVMMNKLGSLSQLLKYMPGMGVKFSPEMIQRGEVELVRFRAIICSMTPKERLNTTILNNSRMQRVAKGAGVNVVDVAQLLKRFEEAKQYVKL
ncbi:MAG TPA: signal recognition particle protein [Candidatus Babeliales bacterium]|jgi:signal recognition particle subunit SRP54|nr:signal recognition particle protein [Candidatus Babeliales bacterium]